MLRNLQNAQDSTHGGKIERTWDAEDDKSKCATTDPDQDPRPDAKNKRPLKPSRLAKKDLRKVLDNAAALNPAAGLEFITQKPYERLTAAALSGYSASAIYKFQTRRPLAVSGQDTVLMQIAHAEAERDKGALYRNWNSRVSNYTLPRASDDRTDTSASQYGNATEYNTPHNSLGPGIHGTVRPRQTATPAINSTSNEPSWNLLPTRPSEAEAMHLWTLRKRGALAFHIAAKHLLKLQLSQDGIPILPNYDDQLRMILVGEAGVGKSRVIRAISWFAHQHGLARNVILSSYQGRPVANLKNPAVRGMTSCMLYQIDGMHQNRANMSQKAKKQLEQNLLRIALDITDEASLTSADHFEACDRQAQAGLSDRAVPGCVFGGLNRLLVLDHLQHTAVTGGALWYGMSSSIAQAWSAHHRDKNTPSAMELPRVAAGTQLFRQFDKVVILDEQMRQNSNIPGATKLHDVLSEIRSNNGVTKSVLEQFNSRAIGMPGMPQSLADLDNPCFVVPRHSLIDIINREMIPALAAKAQTRLIRFYAEIVTLDNEDMDYDLPPTILDLARKRPRTGTFQHTPIPFSRRIRYRIIPNNM